MLKCHLLIGKKVDLFWPPGLSLEIPGRKRVWGAVRGADRIGARRDAVPGDGMVPLTGRTKLGKLPSRHRAGLRMSPPPLQSQRGLTGPVPKLCGRALKRERQSKRLSQTPGTVPEAVGSGRHSEFYPVPVCSKNSNVADVTCYAPPPSPNFRPTGLRWRDL